MKYIIPVLLGGAILAAIIYRIVVGIHQQTCHITYYEMCEFPEPGSAGMCVEPKLVETEICE